MPRKRRSNIGARSSKSIKRALKLKHESPENKAIRIEKAKVSRAAAMANETLEHRENRLALARERTKRFRENLKNSAKAIDVNILENLYNKQDNSTALKLNKREASHYRAYLRFQKYLEEGRVRAAVRRSQESPEQRAARLEYGRSRLARLRANESEEERAARLLRQRLYARDKRMRFIQENQLESSTKTRIKPSRNCSKSRYIASSDAFLQEWGNSSQNNLINNPGEKDCQTSFHYSLELLPVSNIECDVIIEELEELEHKIKPEISVELRNENVPYKQNSDIDENVLDQIMPEDLSNERQSNNKEEESEKQQEDNSSEKRIKIIELNS